MTAAGLTPSFSNFIMLTEISVIFLLKMVKASFKFSDNAFLIGIYEEIKGIVIPEITPQYIVKGKRLKEVFSPEYLNKYNERITLIIYVTTSDIIIAGIEKINA